MRVEHSRPRRDSPRPSKVDQRSHRLALVHGIEHLPEKPGRAEEARAEFERAAPLTQNSRERSVLLERMARCGRRCTSGRAAACPPFCHESTPQSGPQPNARLQRGFGSGIEVTAWMRLHGERGDGGSRGPALPLIRPGPACIRSRRGCATMRSRPDAEATLEADRASDLIPFVHVADLARSFAVHERLGFSVKATREHEGQLDWVALEAGWPGSCSPRRALPSTAPGRPCCSTSTATTSGGSERASCTAAFSVPPPEQAL
jgi:hypothetical protein